MLSDYTFSNPTLCGSDSIEPFRLEGHLESNIADNNWLENPSNHWLTGSGQQSIDTPDGKELCMTACEEHTVFECLSVNFRE